MGACRYFEGNVSFHSKDQHSLVVYGKSFSEDERLIIQNAFETYMNARGKGVIAA